VLLDGLDLFSINHYVGRLRSYQTTLNINPHISRRLGDGGDRREGGRGRGRGEIEEGREHQLLVFTYPPRPDREPEPNIFIDRQFNYWNLPANARVLLVSNVPKVSMLGYFFRPVVSGLGITFHGALL
jgi:hypothetical protein